MLRKKPDFSKGNASHPPRRTTVWRSVFILCFAILVLATVSVFVARTCSAESVGPNSPSSASTESGLLDEWSDPANVYLSDNSRAYYGNTGQKKLRAYNFGFSIPANTTIDGFLVQVEGYASYNGTKNKINIALSKSSYTVEGNAKADLLPVLVENESYIDLGGSSDKWGGNWSSSDVNNSDFGVLIWDWDTGQDALYVDHVKVTVYYTPTTPRRGRRRLMAILGGN